MNNQIINYDQISHFIGKDAIDIRELTNDFNINLIIEKDRRATLIM